jgi:hypothetical protein
MTDPPPPPAAWKGTPAQYHALMNTAGFTWNPQTAAWKYRTTDDPGPSAEAPQPSCAG